jgi:fatty acid desaturase
MTTVRANVQTGATLGRLDPRLLAPSAWRGYAQVLGNIAAFVAVLCLARVADAAWQWVVLYLASGLALHRLFFPLHDCIHYSLFPARWQNYWWGSVLSALLGTSLDAIRTQHLDHHRDFATPEDPGAADYYVRFRSRWSFLAFVLGPLVGSILVKKLWDYVTRPAAAAADANEQLRSRPPLGKRLASYAIILAVQAAVCALLTSGFRVSELWRYPVFNVLPAVTVFLFLIRLRMFLEHGSLNYAVCDYLDGRRPTARTIYASRWERLFVCGSDFNYHHEHHLFPVVPGWQLPRLHRDLVAAGLDPEDVRPTYCQALREIWRNLPWSAPATGSEPARVDSNAVT